MRTFKIEIKLNNEQKSIIYRSIGCCRFLYNLFIETNKKIYEETKKFIFGYDFDKYVNGEYITNNPDKIWIKECNSKTRKEAIMQADNALRRFLKDKKDNSKKRKSGYPKFKKRNNQHLSFYLPMESFDYNIERNGMLLRTIGWVEFKEFGYIPRNAKVLSFKIKIDCNRFYLTLVVDENQVFDDVLDQNLIIGIDLGIKTFVQCSNNYSKPNINKCQTIKKIKRKIKFLQRKYRKMHPKSKNRKKVTLKIQKLFKRWTDLRTDYIKKTVSEIIKFHPIEVKVEDLNVSGMLKSRKLSRAISEQCFYMFRNLLEIKCKQHGIKFTVINRWYPSTKTCSHCGNINKELKLSDRTYHCSKCGISIDRDINASINIQNYA